MTAPVEILPQPKINLFTCKSRKEIVEELKKRHTPTCFCGKPAKYYLYCWNHAPKEVKQFYFQRKILEKQALIDYKATPNDVQNPSVEPEKLVAIGSDCKGFVTFAKIRHGHEIGIIHCQIERTGVKA